MNAERDRAFRLSRSQQLRDLVQLHRTVAGDVTTLMGEALARIEQQLGSVGLTEFQAWQLPQLRRSIQQSMAEINIALGSTVSDGANNAWNKGVDLVDRPLEAGGIRLSAVVPEPDIRQLLATRTFLVDRMHDVTANAAREAANQLGLVVLGSQSPSTAIDAIVAKIEGGRRRALTIVRTELGRAFSVAAQERKAEAVGILPGLRKQWRRSGKVHSRPAHDVADGQIAEVHKPYVVDGVELMFPRDPSGPAKETINCGCASLPHMEHWEVAQPGRRPFSDAELVASRFKRELDGALAG